jgi:SAM-dependent methyltransferase
MGEYTASTYGDRIADIYDDWVVALGRTGETDATVAFLAGLAGTGPVLELGIGTGRVALPLAARGIEVRGIDASEAMLARLRAKPGGDRIPVVLGDLADVGVDGPFRLVFVVFNTLFALPSQDAQVRCFANVAQRLAGDGVFVVEAFVPDLGRFTHGQKTAATLVETDRVVLETSQHDPVAQRVTSAHVVLTRDGARIDPVHTRYAWPSELDLMARLAGLRLDGRFAGWDREPFTAGSGRHVSVYERA